MKENNSKILLSIGTDSWIKDRIIYLEFDGSTDGTIKISKDNYIRVS